MKIFTCVIDHDSETPSALVFSSVEHAHEFLRRYLAAQGIEEASLEEPMDEQGICCSKNMLWVDIEEAEVDEAFAAPLT